MPKLRLCLDILACTFVHKWEPAPRMTFWSIIVGETVFISSKTPPGDVALPAMNIHGGCRKTNWENSMLAYIGTTQS